MTACGQPRSARHLRRGVLRADIFDGDDVSDFYLVRGNINLAAVYQHVAVIHELTGLPPRSRESRDR